MLVDQIATSLRLKAAYVLLVGRTASHRYKTYQIPKRTKGMRTIDHPARELKLIQGWLIENVFERLPIHNAAMAYKKGASTLRNAALHKSKNYLLKVDFEDFFHSITGIDVEKLLTRNGELTKGAIAGSPDIDYVRKIVCRRDRLTIGAPSSPILSNIVMFEFDREWSSYCDERDIIYSRYADDLYFSTNARGLLEGVLVDLRRDISDRTSPALRINERKTVFTSRKRRRLVTGLVLTPAGDVSLGRHRKRYIRSLVFKNAIRPLPEEERLSLMGLLAYAHSIEPGFIESLRKKYGASAIGEEPPRA